MVNICQVSLKGNIPIILDNLKSFNKLYKKNYFYIICPSKEKKFFKQKIKKKNVKIIDENDLISFKKFRDISNKYLKKKVYYKTIQNRLTWYYQQILKLSFMINFIEKNKKNMTIWDADTILLKKLEFNNKKFTNYFGTTSEFHKAYYVTNEQILGHLPKYFISSLAQFVSASPSEIDFLVKNLRQKQKKNKKTSIWLTKIIMSSIAKVHDRYNGSMFSEYELIGQSNLIFNYKKQVLVSGIRDNLSGRLSNIQIVILKILGFKYIAYEHARANIYSKNMLNQKQPWGKFIYILLKKISNNFFRGLKHHISFFLKLSSKKIR